MTQSSNPPTAVDPDALFETIFTNDSLRQRIRFVIMEIRSDFGLDSSQDDDLAQAYWAEMFRALARFDPARSRSTTFARRVLDKWALHERRRLRVERRRRACDVSIEHGDEPDVYDHRADPAELACLRLDQEAAFVKMPEELRPVADELCRRRASEAARVLNVHRGTVYRGIDKIRAAIPEFDPGRLDD